MENARNKSKASISRLQTMAKVSESGDKWFRRKNSVRRLIGASGISFEWGGRFYRPTQV